MNITFKKRLFIAIFISIVTTLLLLMTSEHDGKIFLRLVLGGVIGYTLLFYLFKTGKIDYTKQHDFTRILLYIASIFTLLAGINHFSQFQNTHHDDSFFVINGNAWIVDFFAIMLAGLLFYIAFSSIYLLWERKKLTDNESVKAELLTLKNQINPHFYFNTLNNLYALIKKDQNKAQEFVLKLSNLMRYNIYKGGKKYVTLAEEIEYLQDYIDLQTSRFERKVQIDFTSEIDDFNTPISPLLFIILLENAFKHGIEKQVDKGEIEALLKEEDGEVEFHIENSFESYQENHNVGIGLKNLKESLNILYPNKHILQVEKLNHRYSVNLRIST